MRLSEFQFQKVRLKVIQPSENGDEHNEFQFQKVRLKASLVFCCRLRSSISIPKGSIKSDPRNSRPPCDDEFQFQKVRLKVFRVNRATA